MTSVQTSWSAPPFLIWKFSSIAGACGIAFVLYVACLIGYRILLHPLSKYPGPLLGKFTSIPAYAAVAQQRRTLILYELFKKYGSPFRITTNELVFADKKSWTDIYGQSSNPFTKDPSLYEMFTVTGQRNVLNSINKVQHARLRRLLNPAFSLKNLLASQPAILDKVDNYMHFVIGESKGKPIDIYHKTNEHYLDIVSLLSFGKSTDCLLGKNPNFINNVEAFVTVVPATSFFPFLRYLPINGIKEGFKGVARLEAFSRSSVEDFVQKLTNEDPSTKGSFLENLVNAVDPETGAKLSKDEVVENAIIFLQGGTSTTAYTTLWFMWECARNPGPREKLMEEIRTTFPDPNIKPNYTQASKLPYLQAMIEETLRVWGVLSGAPPRVSPGRTVSNHFVPKGTIVSTLAYATARDPEVFPNPEAFIPERWLNATADMKSMSRPFSTGPTGCIGRSLAEVTLTLTLSRLYQLFDVEVDPSMTDSMMSVRDKGVMEPWGAKFLVRFIPVH